jgi:DNA-binding transcriptional LysR family regulator
VVLDSVADVRVFVQVVDSNGLAAAARVLGLPANTVSRTVARLEAALGARLLLRTTRRMSVTNEGRAFYEQALGLLEAVGRAEAAVAPVGAGLSGAMRLAVRTTTVQFGMLPDLLALLKANPGLRVDLTVTDEPVDLVGKGLDLALQIGTLPDSTLRARSLGHVRFALAATKGYLDAAGRPAQPSDLAQHECVRPQSGRPVSTWTLVGPRGKRATVLVRGRFECSDVRTQREAIYGGFGIGARPVGELAGATSLERVLEQWVLEPIAVHVVFPPLRPGPARAEAVEAVVALLQRAVARMNGGDK